MSTQSRIGIQNKDGTYKSIYCHYDGYPSWVGRVLLEHYTTKKKIWALLRLGDLSSLGRELGTKHDFNDCDAGYCTAYHRDRGEVLRKCVQHKSLKEWEKYDNGQEYNYFFREGVWWMFTGEGLETLSTVEMALAVEKFKRKIGAL